MNIFLLKIEVNLSDVIIYKSRLICQKIIIVFICKTTTIAYRNHYIQNHAWKAIAITISSFQSNIGHSLIQTIPATSWSFLKLRRRNKIIARALNHKVCNSFDCVNCKTINVFLWHYILCLLQLFSCSKILRPREVLHFPIR